MILAAASLPPLSFRPFLLCLQSGNQLPITFTDCLSYVIRANIVSANDASAHHHHHHIPSCVPNNEGGGGGTPILDLTGCAAQQGVLLR